MQEEHKTPQEEPALPADKPVAASLQYDSNPFTLGWAGIQRLIKTNTHTVIGTTLFNILIFVVLGVTGAAMAFAFFAFFIKYNASTQGAVIPAGTIFEFLNSMSDSSIYLTWIIGAIVIILVLTLLQTLVLNLTIASAKGVTLKFGALLKVGLRTVMPILGFTVLILLAVLVASIAVALMAVALGPLTILVGLLLAIAAIYIGLRLAYATYSIVDLRLGPVAAMKHSWKISEGHLIETVGAGAVTWLIAGVPSLVFSALAKVTEGTAAAAVFGLLDAVVALVLIVVTAVPMAERYVQIQALQDKQASPVPLSPANYLAIVLVVILAPIMSTLSPSPKLSDGSNGLDWSTSTDFSSPSNSTNSTNGSVYQLN